MDLAGARFSKDPGALAQGGARREDVVDEEDPAGHGAPRREGARDVRPARSGGELDLIPGPAHDLQFIQNWRVYPPCDPPGHELRLAEAPLREPRTVQRYRHDRIELIAAG
jgi:hypothetical protein